MTNGLGAPSQGYNPVMGAYVVSTDEMNHYSLIVLLYPYVKHYIALSINVTDIKNIA